MSRRAHFLELVSGWVEGVGVPPARIPLQGHLELASPFPRVTTNYSAVASGFARVWRCPEGVQLIAVGSDAVAMINDAPVHRAVMKHGDLVTWGDVTLRFLEVEVPEHRNPGLEAAIMATPDDDACWQVYADWLLSLGDPLGERIRGLRTDDTEFLGNLKPLVTEHAALTIEWSHGFIRSAVLRSWGAVQADELLTWLLELPVTRFLRSLEVELRD
ncbi:MAG: TIGR02996 domain-containing protein [Archangium sp.]|nr:TIGR02996 domain-containing protein [Archangium sp.]